MNFKFSHHFQYVIRTVCINFGAETFARVWNRSPSQSAKITLDYKWQWQRERDEQNDTKSIPISARISKICSETLSQCFTLWKLVERWNSHLEEKLPCRCTAHMICMVITWMSVRFGKKLHGNRKLHEAKPCRIWTVVSTIFVALKSMWFNRHDLPSLSASGHYRTIYNLTPCNFKWTRAISSEPVQFQVNACNFKWTRAISSEPVQFQVNPCKDATLVAKN